MKEIVLALKNLLAGKSVAYQGEYVNVEEIKFDTPEDDVDPQAAVDSCKMFLTQYIGQQPHITENCGATPEQIAGVKSVMGWPATQEQIREATQFVPDELVRSVCPCGATSEAMERIEAFVAAGCTEPVLTPLANAESTIERVARAVRRDG